MIIIIITAIASLMTLDYIDTKKAEKSAKSPQVFLEIPVGISF